MKFLFDLLPVLLFFITFKLYGIYTATAVAIAATFIQIAWVWFRHRKVDKMLWVSLVIIVLLGGATLALQDETFIKWKPTVLYWVFATVLLVATSFFNKNLIRVLLEKQIALPDVVWGRVNLSWVAFFLFMGFINLYVAFSYSIDTWVNFKLFGSTGLMLVFIVIQGAMLGKHIKQPQSTSNTTLSEEDVVLNTVAVDEVITTEKGKDS